MPSLLTLLHQVVRRLRFGLKPITISLAAIFVSSFVYYHTNKRILPFGQPIELKSGSRESNSLKSDSFDTSSYLKKSFSPPKGFTSPLSPPVGTTAAESKNLTPPTEENFDTFNQWLIEFKKFVCSDPKACLEHDPRYARNLILRGESLARARAQVMSDMITNNPRKAISLAISDEVSSNLPSSISTNVEKWQHGLIDVKTWHSCKSPNHQNCKIDHRAIFEDGSDLQLFTYGDRKNLPSVKGLSAWGISLGNKFAMSDQPLRNISNPLTNGGEFILAGTSIHYETTSEKTFFEELVLKAERHGRRSGRIFYPLSMGSNGTVREYLRERYEIKFLASDFSSITERIPKFDDETYPENKSTRTGLAALGDLHHAGYLERPGRKLLQIETRAENDYIVELLKEHFGHIPSPNTTKIWIGLTKDENQTTTVYDRKNNLYRDVNLTAWGADGSNWFWLDGSEMNFSNWDTGEPNPANLHTVLDWSTGKWETTSDSAELPYILEKNLPFEIGSTSSNLLGTRKILIVPARFEDQTTKMRSSTDSYSQWKWERNHLQTNEFGEIINEDVYTEPFEPISRSNLEAVMQEVVEYYQRNTDQELNLIPIITPTVTIPWRVRDIGNGIGGGGEHEGDTDGSLTGPSSVDYTKGNPVLDFAEYAMIEAGKQSEEWDFYGPAFVGVTEIKLHSPYGSFSSTDVPLVALEGGAFLKPETLLPHPRFKAAELEAILNEEGNLSAIRIIDTGSYYFDEKFGHRWDSGGRSIFQYNYKIDDNQTDTNSRSALYDYRDLCQKLDSDGDGFAEYISSTVKPVLMVNGVELPSTSYDVSISNVCLTWVGLTNYEQEEEGLAWYGAPGAHVLIRDENVSSQIIAHEIGHNFGLMHAQRYESRGEQTLSDEGEKVPYGNPYSLMGSAPSIINGSGDLTIAEKLFLNDLYDGQAGFKPGLNKNDRVDILDLKNATDLTITNLKEQDPAGIPNKFRIYQANSPGPPLALREANYSIKLPQELNGTPEWDEFTNILAMLDEYFGEANYSNGTSATDLNKTASDLNKTIKLNVIGTGEDAVANLVFRSSGNPILEIVNGGRGFIKEPTFKILEENNRTELLTIDRNWIWENTSSDLRAQLFDSEFSNRWIRGIRVNVNSLVSIPTGLDVGDKLNTYYLSYRTDISSTGLAILVGNNPDINGSYTMDREYFYTRNEAFLLDATPQTPKFFEDASLLVGTTYSDHGADIHITPTAIGGFQSVDSLKTEIDKQRDLVATLKINNQELRDEVLAQESLLTQAQSEYQRLKILVENEQALIANYEALNLTETELYAEAQERLAYQEALWVLSQSALASAEVRLEASFVNLEESDLVLNTESMEYNRLTKQFQIDQENFYPYIECVVNIGTVTSGLAQVPIFELNYTTLSPAVGEKIKIRALVQDGNTSGYSYAWFINETPFQAAEQLNKPVISTEFTDAGHYVVRVVVSDMKGGVSSRNLVVSVGETEKKNQSIVTGAVRSQGGFVQGARAVISEAPIIEHKLSLSGNLRDSFYPSGNLEPASFNVDGLRAPELTFRRGEVHRFYLDKSLDEYHLSFLEKPENTPPRISIHMLTDPRASLGGSAYYRNPDVNFTTRSAFASYLSSKTGTYLEMLEYLQDHNFTAGQSQKIDLNETVSSDPDYLDLLEYFRDNKSNISRFVNKTNQVTNPYPKALLSETNVTKGIVGPTFANELGYITFGGRGYDRNDTPKVDVRRSSIWENYNESNATAIARVDGIGTISPINAVNPEDQNAEFLGSSWTLRREDDTREVTVPDTRDDPTLLLGSTTNLPPVPDLVVWGTGGGDKEDPLSEVNASVAAWKTTAGINSRTINIYNQGKGFEPNSTMAVLHYPRDPFAYWSFDRHESLFEDRSKSRHQPSPAWNRELSGLGDRLIHYWSMDDEINASTLTLSNDINKSMPLDINAIGTQPHSTWGLRGNAVNLDGDTELSAPGAIPTSDFSLSFWVKLTPGSDLNMTIGGLALDFNGTNQQAKFNGDVLTLESKDTFNDWMHLAVVVTSFNTSLYVDGRRQTSDSFTISTDELLFESLDGLLDEVKIYDIFLTESHVRYLSGRNYLDLSGNKYHLTPIGEDFIPISPDSLPASTDVPEDFSYPNTPVIGTRIMRLGDSYPDEDHGRSISLDGLDDYFDLSPHILDFGIPQGTISMWVKTTTSYTSPLFWVSSPLEIIEVPLLESNGSQIITTPGNFFAMELVNGLPRIAGVSAYEQTSKINDGLWHHVVGAFPDGRIWIDGVEVPVAGYNIDDLLFTGSQSPLDFISDANEIYIGRAPDRSEPYTIHEFKGSLDDIIVYDRTLTNDEVSYLYELRRGREQVPRLEAVVDAIGTVTIEEGGSGYRENPDLIFWYGEKNETKNDLLQFANEGALPSNRPHGTLALVQDSNLVYTRHIGKESFRAYPWRYGGTDNNWRKHAAAAGIGEFGGPDLLIPNLEDVVWTKKMDTVTAIPLPDGRWDKRLYIEYVTMDETLASSSIINRGFVKVDGIKFSSADGGSSNAGYTLRILENPGESGTGLNHIFVDYNSTTHQITIETNGSANDFSRKDIVTAINNSAKEQGFVEVDGIRFSLKDPWPSKLNFSIELNENLTATLDDNVSVDLNLTTKHILIETNGTASDFSRKSIVDAINSSNSTNESVVASLVDENDTGKLSGTFNSIDLNWTAPVNKLVLASLVDTNDDGNLSGTFSGISLNFRPYSKPNGLSGFVELPYFEVASPEVHNPDALPAYRATAYGLFFIDHDENDSLTIVDGGTGFDVPNAGFDLISGWGEPFSVLQFMVRGKGFQPTQEIPYYHTYGGRDTFKIAKEDWNGTTWNDANFFSSTIYEGGSLGRHTSNDPSESFSGDNWYGNVVGLKNSVTTKQINIGGDPADAYNITELTIDASQTELNKTMGSVTVDSSGYGYAMPIELSVVGGRPMYDERVGPIPMIQSYVDALGIPSIQAFADSDGTDPIQRGQYQYKDAEFNVTKIDSNGSILKGKYRVGGPPANNTAGVEILDGGLGYIPFNTLPKTDPYTETSYINTDSSDLEKEKERWYGAPDPPNDFHLNEYPFVSVSGGGGYGAKIRITEIDRTNGEIIEIEVLDGGRGYFNIDPANKPTATLLSPSPVVDPHRDANLSVRLGGSLKEIPPCTGCSSGKHSDAPNTYSHLEPWIEIWDRGRKESEIGDRAHAAPKVVNGKIVKVVVTNSGSGYIDPVAIVRDVAPRHEWFLRVNNERQWKCTFKRVTKDGEEVECGHIISDIYPPDLCPGETDENLPFEQNGTRYIATGNEITAWRGRHFPPCGADPNSHHRLANFVTRKCWGTKVNYELQNPYYRRYNDDQNLSWIPLEAKLSVVSENGRILRIEVIDEGQDYFSSKLSVEGSGTGVDAIPIYNEYGVNTRVIFDDPRLTNDQLDKLDYRSGAGQGFRERPWSWDDTYDSFFGGREKVKVYAWHSDVIQQDGGLTHAAWDWNFGEPVLQDNLGDRVVSVDITDSGLYPSDLDTDGVNDLDVPAVRIDYNSTVDFHDSNSNPLPSKDMSLLDHDGDGYVDFSAAQVSTQGTYTITHTLLNHDSIVDFAHTFPELGVFTETPVLEFHDERNLRGWNYTTDYVKESASDFIRLNQRVTYDPEKELSYIELYVDDRFPNQLYYGLDLTDDDLTDDDISRVLPQFGNLITVTEGLPGMNWAVDEPGSKTKYSYTDSNGFYALPQLDAGFYNVAVFMEDQKLQESTFRPDANITRISQVLYLSGFPELTLETDQYGQGRSSLVWAPAARRLSRPAKELSEREEYDQEYRVLKQLDGIGRGFDPLGPLPELTFVADVNNVSLTPPNIEVKVLVDGSLQLRIIDDENTSKYFPQDKFRVFHNSQVSGLDFVETYLYTESNQTFSFGTKAEATPGIGRLILSPNDSNGTNPVSTPVSTFEREWNTTTLSWVYNFRERPLQLRALVYDQNGTQRDSSSVEWSAHLDFNDTNTSRVIQLESNGGTRGLSVTGSSINAYLYSLLRKGRVGGIQIIHGGENYTVGSLIKLTGAGTGFLAQVTDINATTGAIIDCEILSHGENYNHSAKPYVIDSTGQGAVLRPELPYSGAVRIDATITIPGESAPTIKSVLLKPSLKYPLDSLETWRNRFTDNFWVDISDPNWLDTFLSDNNDTDTLTNAQEWMAGTDPTKFDSDKDGLSDDQEVEVYFTNPWLPDTDRDGLKDSEEASSFGTVKPSDPLKYDTDKDGISDKDDLQPSTPNGNGIISGLVYKKPLFGSVAKVYFHCGLSSDPFPLIWDENWTKTTNNFYLTGKTYGTYTVRSFIDLSGDGKYQYGEPYAEDNATITAQKLEVYGKYLVHEKPAPILNFFDIPSEADFAVNSQNLLERNVTIDVNETNSLNSFAYAVQAVDPTDLNISNTNNNPVTYLTDVNLTFALGDTFNNNIEFLVDGNFTDYLDMNESRVDYNSTAKFDLNSTPVGKYFLRYRAVDQYGNISPEIIQNIEIKDTQPPYISIFDLEEKRGATTFSKSELRTIIPEINFDLNETNNSVVWLWPYGKPLEVSDITKAETTNGVVLVHVMDTKNEILTDWSIEYYYNEANLSEHSTVQSIINENLNFIIVGPNSIDQVGTYKFEFNATDRSGNELDFTAYVLIHPAYQSTITAVDGYLEGARVGFDADGDGESDLDREFLTNASGQAEVLFTVAEFAKFDRNGNGKLDSNEGKFVVIGGVDTSTGSTFVGKLYADATATVVSPLTTLVAQLMENGFTKEESMRKVSSALGLSTGIDLSTYDPIQKAFEGDSNATFVMMANLRMANLINQSEGLLQALSEDYDGYKVGTDLLNEIAHWISNQKDPGPLNLENALVDAIPVALASVGPVGELTLDDQMALFQLMADSDNAFPKNTEVLSFEELMAEQITFIDELEKLIADLSENLPSPKQYLLEINSTFGGTIFGTGSYSYGSKAAILAVPDEHFEFIEWMGEGLLDKSLASSSILMTKDRNITAVFAPISYVINANSAGGGIVEGNGTFAAGENITLIAIPESGYQFSNWMGYDGPDQANPEINILVSASLSLTAEFKRFENSLSLYSSVGGMVFGGGDYNNSESVSISAVPDSGYKFSSWQGAEVNDPNSPNTYLKLTEDTNLTAKFEPSDSEAIPLSVLTNPKNGGHVAGSGSFILNSENLLTATAFDGFKFDYWSTDEGAIISNLPKLLHTVVKPEILTAHFSKQYYNLTLDSDGQGETHGNGSFAAGNLVSIRANPTDGYVFSRWIGENVANPFQAETTVMMGGDTHIKAIFELQTFSLTLTSNYGGMVKGSGIYNIGEIATLEAVPATGFKLSGWSGEGLESVQELKVFLEMNQSKEVTARFELINNFFTPQGEDFYYYLSSSDLIKDKDLVAIQASDGDGERVRFGLVSGNPDADQDGINLFNLSQNGALKLLDLDEPRQLAGSKVSLTISISDGGGKTNNLLGIVEIAPELFLSSTPLGNEWYDSPWMGTFFSKDNTWIYHTPLGWLYVYPSPNHSYWFWYDRLKEWLWTNEIIYPQVYSGTSFRWLYLFTDEENIRIFDYDLQTWDTLK